MIRNHLAPEPNFRWRGGEISRLEAFSDAVFAFAVTLLVVSLEVPHTYRELVDTMRGFPAFAMCFAMLAQLWHLHARFFRRYGLQDWYTTVLNCVFLFVILFYVYPLKFLFTLFASELSRGLTLPASMRGEPMLTSHEAPSLMVIYGLGYVAVFGVLALLYWNAYRKRDALELDAIELLKTRRSLWDSAAMVGIGLLSVTVAVTVPPHLAGIAGWVYFLVGVYFSIAGSVFGKRERLMAQAAEKKSAAARP